jgi:signal transduction histidine kinase
MFFSDLLNAQTNNVSDDIKFYINKSKKYIENANPVAAIENANKAIDLSIKENDYSVAVSQLQLAKAYQYNHNYRFSFINFWDAYVYFRDKNIIVSQIESLIGIAQLFDGIYLKDKALIYYKSADSLLFLTTNTKYRIIIKHSIANILFNKKEYVYALNYYQELNKFSIQYKDIENQVNAVRGIANCYSLMGEYSNAIDNELSLLSLFKRLKKENEIAYTYSRIGRWYMKLNMNSKAIEYLSLSSQNKLDDSLIFRLNYYKASAYTNLKEFNNASKIISKQISNKKLQNYPYFFAKSLNLWALIPLYNDKVNLSIKRVDSIDKVIDKVNDLSIKDMLYTTIYTVYEQEGDYEKAIVYLKKSMAVKYQISENEINKNKELIKIIQFADIEENRYQVKNVEKRIDELELEQLKEREKKKEQRWNLYKSRQKRLELENANLILKQKNANDSLLLRYNKIKAERIEKDLEIKRAKHKVELEISSKKALIAEEETARLLRNRKYFFSIFTVVIIALILFFIGFVYNRRLNKLLGMRNIELKEKQKETEAALLQLKQTQSQLIESERLASLGQLTAGIAHEIRNPLNFVNNFSSLINELFDELEEILQEMQIPEGELKEELLEVLESVKSNNEKVNKHGNRAARIISSMLDVSSGSHNVFDETDINQLVKESTELAYQGVRGDITTLAVDIKYNLDNSIGNIAVIHQDIGRVIINIVNNACHALEDKKNNNAGFVPLITVTTKNLNNEIEIIIQDNGKGMSKDVQAKIFNPFFTTKPSGKGTGLGMTMTYDIISKKHKGNIMVESEENEFTRIIINIPKNLNNK